MHHFHTSARRIALVVITAATCCFVSNATGMCRSTTNSVCNRLTTTSILLLPAEAVCGPGRQQNDHEHCRVEVRVFRSSCYGVTQLTRAQHKAHISCYVQLWNGSYIACDQLQREDCRAGLNYEIRGSGENFGSAYFGTSSDLEDAYWEFGRDESGYASTSGNSTASIASCDPQSCNNAYTAVALGETLDGKRCWSNYTMPLPFVGDGEFVTLMRRVLETTTPTLAPTRTTPQVPTPLTGHRSLKPFNINEIRDGLEGDSKTTEIQITPTTEIQITPEPKDVDSRSTSGFPGHQWWLAVALVVMMITRAGAF